MLVLLILSTAIIASIFMAIEETSDRRTHSFSFSESASEIKKLESIGKNIETELMVNKQQIEENAEREIKKHGGYREEECSTTITYQGEAYFVGDTCMQPFNPEEAWKKEVREQTRELIKIQRIEYNLPISLQNIEQLQEDMQKELNNKIQTLAQSITIEKTQLVIPPLTLESAYNKVPPKGKKITVTYTFQSFELKIPHFKTLNTIKTTKEQCIQESLTVEQCSDHLKTTVPEAKVKYNNNKIYITVDITKIVFSLPQK